MQISRATSEEEEKEQGIGGKKNSNILLVKDGEPVLSKTKTAKNNGCPSDHLGRPCYSCKHI